MTKKKRDDFSNDNLRAMDDPSVQLGDPMMPDPDMSDEERRGSTDGHKDYTVQIDGAIINGELLNQGDVVTLHPDDAATLMSADVRLTEVPSAV